ncbi:unnamed protein product [Strongylus vulgaris]|uniref:Uncharacterized protein n=1 Tax=Strongylus vulgaris TaxID=40348 RepID=A0A3P7KPA5_STRVU|nr:unnamed protein product [Strongylus vulgaris]
MRAFARFVASPFENFCFQEYVAFQMPLNPSLDATVVLSTSTNAEEAEELDLPEIAFLSAASLELLLDPILGFSFCLISDVCRTSSPSLHLFVTTLPAHKAANEHMMLVPDEQSLFEKLENLVKE